MPLESSTHRALKRVAFDILGEKGFDPSEIKEEFDVDYPINGRMKYVVDVAGIKKTYRVAVECGHTELSKLTALRKIFDEVIWVNTTLVVAQYENWKSRYKIDFENILKENNNLKNELDYIKSRAEEDIRRLQIDRDALESEKRKLALKLNTYQRMIAEACQNQNLNSQQ